jgi:hypothetical protein
MAMKLSTGKVAFPIEFDNGDVQTIFFNPNDRGFINRIMDFENSIDKRIKQIDLEKYKSQLEDGIDITVDFEDIDAVQNMSAEEMASLKNKMKAVLDIDAEYQKALKEELNDIFGSDVSNVVFKYCQPLDAVVVTDENGNETTEPFILQFMKAFSEEIKKYQNKVSPAMQKHINKYAK